MVHGVLQLNLLGQCTGDTFLCWRLASIYGWKVRSPEYLIKYLIILASADQISSQPYMNWFMDILGSVWGGGMFCAIVTMGINVSISIDPFPDFY
jgi:lipid-A-disaccharide synthase-like uncharacterized protein